VEGLQEREIKQECSDYKLYFHFIRNFITKLRMYVYIIQIIIFKNFLGSN